MVNNLEAVEKAISRISKGHHMGNPVIHTDDLLRAFRAYDSEVEEPDRANGLKHGTKVRITTSGQTGTTIGAYNFEVEGATGRGCVILPDGPGPIRCVERSVLRLIDPAPKAPSPHDIKEGEQPKAWLPFKPGDRCPTCGWTVPVDMAHHNASTRMSPSGHVYATKPREVKPGPDTLSEDEYRLLMLRAVQYLSTQTVQSGITFEAFRPLWKDISREIKALRKRLGK